MAGGIFLLGGTTNCSESEPCIEGLQAGDQVKLTIVERYDKTSRFPGDFKDFDFGPCNDAFGLGAGASLIATARIPSDVGGTCTGFFVDIEGATKFTSMSLVKRLKSGDEASAPLAGEYSAAHESGCAGRVIVNLAVQPPSSRPLHAIPSPGQRPRVYLAFDFLPAGGTNCPERCDTRLVVTAEKL